MAPPELVVGVGRLDRVADEGGLNGLSDIGATALRGAGAAWKKGVRGSSSLLSEEGPRPDELDRPDAKSIAIVPTGRALSEDGWAEGGAVIGTISGKTTCDAIPISSFSIAARRAT